MGRISANPQGHAAVRPDPTTVERQASYEPPPPPATLRPEAHAYWAAVWEAGQNAYDGRTDAGIIERYCETRARRDELLALLERDGYVTLGSQGQTVAHPAARLLDIADGRLQALEDRLGLNPEARIRLNISLVEGNSKLEEFLKGAT